MKTIRIFKDYRFGIVIAIVLWGIIAGDWTNESTPPLPSEASATPEPPNLYELARQTAANTRWIFWVLVVGVLELGSLFAFIMINRSK